MRYLKLLEESFPMLVKGLGGTVQVTVISLLIATLLGLFCCLLQISGKKPLQWISQIYIDVMRGVPVMVLSFFIYFGVPNGLGIRLTAVQAGVITLSLNAGAYLSEIFRGGIQAVNVGQMEAARSLGLPYGRAMRKVILPQAVRIVIPLDGQPVHHHPQGHLDPLRDRPARAHAERQPDRGADLPLLRGVGDRGGDLLHHHLHSVQDFQADRKEAPQWQR